MGTQDTSKPENIIGQPTASPDLYKCVTWGDPGILTWHSSTGSSPASRICQDEGMYELVRNNFLTFSVRVRPRGYMVEVGGQGPWLQSIHFYNQ